ncbi:MAG: glycosyltransferase family 2 protein [Vicinamibacteria bacterium]
MPSAFLEVFFWVCLFLVVYAYLGYPLLLALWARGEEKKADAEAPSISMIVAAHNEEAVIESKIRNAIAQDYPEDRLEIVVVSDGSSDGTEAFVRGVEDSRVRLVVQSPRQGKNQALNRGAAVARGEVLVFTDANAMLGPLALRKLVAPFSDARIGLVSGRGLYGGSDPISPEAVSNAYVRYESFIKSRESSLGFVAAADGALYALRRELYRALEWNQVHDLMHPIQVSIEGKRSAFVPEAFTVEPPSRDASVEFRRHVRIIAQGFLVYLGQLPRLLEKGKWRELVLLTSHRPLRWLSSFFLAGALLSNVALAPSSRFYAALLASQVLFYLAAGLGAAFERADVRLRLLAVPYYFCVVSAAGLSGFLHFLRGRGHASWAPTGGS